MREHKFIEVFSLEDARKMASLDAPSMSTSKSYATDNTLSYYLCANTWTLLWKNFSPATWSRFAATLLECGLIEMIKVTQEEATRVINNEQLGPWATLLYSDISRNVPVIDVELNTSLIGVDNTTTVLFLLRYPKRFSPNGNDRIKDLTLKDFIATENRTKMLQRRETYGYTDVCKYVRDVISRMYDWDEIVAEIDQLDDSWFTFSSGAALDARATLGDKVCAICRDGNITDYIRPVFGQNTMPQYACHRISEQRISKVVAVPKSYKASRIIAMEATARIAKGKQIEDIFRNHDRRTHVLNLEDQTINQRMAQEGSIDGSIATLDASHASDLISKSLFVDLFPTEYVRRVQNILPNYVQIGDRVQPLQMLSTSGHTLTFRHETIVYKAISQAAVEYMCGLCPDLRAQGAVSWAYGDDSLVSAYAYDTAVYFFTRLGLKINEEKSYSTGEYRESCGKDYISGMDVTSIYFPRFPIIGSYEKGKVTLSNKVFRDEYRGKLDNALTMLIDLQKKIFPFSYDAARLVTTIVQLAYPSVTSSVKGAVCSDLWDYVDTGRVPACPGTYRREHVGKYAFPKVYKAVRIGTAEDTLTGRNLSVFRRARQLDTVHTAPSVAFRSGKRVYTAYERDVYEYWRYQNFLKNGPRYLDPLSKLLGVSDPPMTIHEFYGVATLVLSKR